MISSATAQIRPAATAAPRKGVAVRATQSGNPLSRAAQRVQQTIENATTTILGSSSKIRERVADVIEHEEDADSDWYDEHPHPEHEASSGPAGKRAPHAGRESDSKAGGWQAECDQPEDIQNWVGLAGSRVQAPGHPGGEQTRTKSAAERTATRADDNMQKRTHAQSVAQRVGDASPRRGGLEESKEERESKLKPWEVDPDADSLEGDAWGEETPAKGADERTREVVRNVSSKAENAGDQAKRGASEAADRTKQSVSSAAVQTKQTVNSAAEGAKGKASEARDNAGKAGERAEHHAESAAHRAGDRTMETADKAGEAGERLKDRAGSAAEDVKDSAKRTGERAQQTADRAGDRTRETAHKAGEAGERLKDRAGSAAEDAKDSAKRTGERVQQTAADAGEQAKEKAGSAAQTVKETVSEVGQKVKETVGSVVNPDELFRQVKDTEGEGDQGTHEEPAKHNAKRSEAASEHDSEHRHGRAAGEKVKEAEGWMRETGEDVREGAGEVMDRVKGSVKEVGQNVKETARDVGNKAKEVTNDAAEGAKDVGHRAKEATSDAAEGAKRQANRAGDELDHSAKNVAEAGRDKAKSATEQAKGVASNASKSTQSAAEDARCGAQDAEGKASNAGQRVSDKVDNLGEKAARAGEGVKQAVRNETMSDKAGQKTHSLKNMGGGAGAQVEGQDSALDDSVMEPMADLGETARKQSTNAVRDVVDTADRAAGKHGTGRQAGQEDTRGEANRGKANLLSDVKEGEATADERREYGAGNERSQKHESLGEAARDTAGEAGDWAKEQASKAGKAVKNAGQSIGNKAGEVLEGVSDETHHDSAAEQPTKKRNGHASGDKAGRTQHSGYGDVVSKQQQSNRL